MFWSHGSWEMSSFVRILWTWSSWECFQTYKPTDSLRKNQPVSIAWRNRCRIGLSKDLWLFKAHWTMLQWFIHLAELAEVVRQDAMSTKIPWMPSTKKNSNLRLQRKNTTWPKKKMCRAPVPTSFLGDSGGQIYCKLFASKTHQFSSSMAKHGCLLTSKKKEAKTCTRREQELVSTANKPSWSLAGWQNVCDFRVPAVSRGPSWQDCLSFATAA